MKKQEILDALDEMSVWDAMCVFDEFLENHDIREYHTKLDDDEFMSEIRMSTAKFTIHGKPA